MKEGVRVPLLSPHLHLPGMSSLTQMQIFSLPILPPEHQPQPGSGGAQGALPRQGQQPVWPSLQSPRDLKLKPVPSPFLLPVKFLLSRC